MSEFTLINPVLTTYEWSDRPSLGTTATTNPNNNSQTTPGQEITLGGFSGLYYEGKAANGNLKFITNTDRGPNGEPTDLIPSIPGSERPFALPNFQPELVRFELDRTTGQITITERIGLKRSDGTALTGLPNLQSGAAGTAYTDEVAIDLFGNRLANDALGADLEGVVVADDGTFWMVDEYRPAIYHFDGTGQLIDRFIPKGTPTEGGEFGTAALPKVYAQRRNNRGFEAVALEGTKLYTFIQSAIDNPDSAADTTSRGSQNLRILEFDVTTQAVTGEYLYRLDDISGSGTARTDKIGDAVALGNGKFLVVERDDRGGSNANKLIYEIDLKGATNINSAANLTKIPVGKTIEQLSAVELQDANVQTVSKQLVTNAAMLGYTGVEKLEGLAVTESGAIALLNDNDFGLQSNPAKGDGTVSLNDEPTPVKLGIIEPKSTIRFSQFNASLNRNNEGDLVKDLSTPDNAQAKSVAEIIQRSNPDVLLINEFDYVASNPLQPVDLFKKNYLAVSQNGANPVDYPYVYIAPSNTGIASGLDLDNAGNIVTTVGATGYGNDAFGFGNFPGQFGMVLLSKYPIDTANVRTFQNFLWKDMPDSLLPTISTDGSAPFYSAAEQSLLPLSSKSHWDVPIQVNSKTIHALVSHPTPPTFDGVEDRNGKRNHDEIRFWSDYVASEDYIYDDKGQKGGLSTGSSFVIMGDQNADPVDGDSFDNAITQLLQNPKINTTNIPTSPGAPQQSALQAGANLTQKGNPNFDTADFSDTAPGNLRTDYVLPSADLTITDSRVFWPSNDDPLFGLVGTFDSKLPGGFPSSDHRLVWADVQVSPQASSQVASVEPGKAIAQPSLQGEVIFPTGFIPSGAAGTVNGIATPVGGLSGVTYDAANQQYYAISDDRSQVAPARFYTFTADLSATPTINFTNFTPLKDSQGNFFATNSLDPEGIALTANGTVFISSEGEANPSTGRVTAPFIKEFSLATGQEVRSLPIPSKFLPVIEDTNGSGTVDVGDLQKSGVRNNLAFESLTISPNQKTLYTATENALFQDGATTTRTDGSRSRILQYNLVTGQPEKEYLYVTDAIVADPNPATGSKDNGLVDLLAIDSRGTLLALERSFAQGVGNTIKIYQVSLQGTSDISTINSLSSLSAEQFAAIQPAQKQLLLNLDTLKLPTGTDNIEGITWGPKLADGRQSIVLVSDNNFSATQFTQVLALGADQLLTALPTVETPSVIDSDVRSLAPQSAFLGDADDPAVWVNPNDAGNSLVLGTLKNGGLATFNLDGTVAQDLSVTPYGDRRYNNVDVLYNFKVGGKTVDLAIATDRRNDTLTIWSIDPVTRQLTDITAPSLSVKSASIFGIDDGSKTAYGLATYTSANGKSYAFVSQRQSNQIAQLELSANSDGTIGAKTVRTLSAPIPAGKKLEDSQFEGMVVDKELGYLYAGQEQRGIWKYQAEPTANTQGSLIQAVKPEGKELTADVEGLTIYYGKNGTGYLLASSQGDSTYAVYSRDGDRYLGSFAVGSNGTIDGAQQSDGAEVINLPLGAKYPQGLFIAQDGDNLPAVIEDGENINTNFKFVPWEQVAQALPQPLAIDTNFNPRNLKPLTLPNQVASGDTTQNSTVLWTRSEVTGAVKFEYSTRSDFSQIAGTQTVTVTNPLQPVKIQVDGLTPNTPYYYRATDAAGVTGVGQFNTAAEVGTRTGLRFGAAGDWRGELSPYPAIANADQQNLAFFISLGDTIYADFASPALDKPQAETLEEYRLKHNEVYSQRNGLNTWGDLRSSTSILAVIDDHEVTNDFAGGALASSDPRLKDSTPGKLVNDTALYNNGLQSFQEYNPIRDEFYGETGDARTAGERKLYRYNTYGSDAASFVLDARSFRDEELEGVTNPADASQVTNFLVQSYNPDRTLLGRQQIADLKKDLLDAEQQGITWKYIVVPEPIQNLGVVAAGDRFEGYAAERTEILKFINENDISNVVFISADIHSTLVNNLTYQTAPGQDQIATSAFEITTGSVGFDAPFGPTVAELASGINLLSAEQKAFYDLLPATNDADSLPNDKDDFIKQLVNSQLKPFGYDPLGLNDNLTVADGKINAKLLQGDYLSTQTYAWTQFDIDALTQKLTVTTYGIPYYTEAELKANPSEIASRTPTIVSQFEVQPAILCDAKANELRGTDGADEIKGLGGNDTLLGLGGDDKLSGGEGDDLLRGGTGNNTLLGGRGGDRFAIGEGSDIIADFNVTEGDRIALINASFSQLTLTQGTGANAKDTLIHLAGSNNLLGSVKGVEVSALTPAVFTTV